jgi:hypothetical protein
MKGVVCADNQPEITTVDGSLLLSVPQNGTITFQVKHTTISLKIT